MKKLMSYTMLALLATVAVSIAAPDKTTILAKENAAWQAFKDKDPAAFKKVVDGDIVAVYADSIAHMKDELNAMRHWDMKSFKITGFTATSDEPDVIVTSYKIAVKGSFDGKDASGLYNAGSVWKSEKGVWLVIFHTNVKQEK